MTDKNQSVQLRNGVTAVLKVKEAPHTLWSDAWRRLKKNKTFPIAAAILIFYILVAIFAPIIAPYNYSEQFRKDGLTSNGSPVAPNTKFILGTDTIGRDLLSRIIYGTQTAMVVGLCVSILTVLVGALYGSLAGLATGWLDTILMRIVDILLSLPQLFIILLFIAILNQRSLWITIAVLAILNWTGAARIFRSEVVSLKEREFVLAERSMGAESSYIYFRHIFPQLLPLMIISVGMGIPYAIFMEASMSFLGLGVPPPWPTWGGMVSDGQAIFRTAWWLLVFPGTALITLVVSLNLIADSLRQALDPRLKGK